VAEFIPGLKLSRIFFQETVEPVLKAHFQNLPVTAALIGDGSEILGFDTPQSMDHHWGARLLLFLRESDHERYAAQLSASLSSFLPTEVCGHLTNFSAPDHSDNGVRRPVPGDAGHVQHMVENSYHRWLSLQATRLNDRP